MPDASAHERNGAHRTQNACEQRRAQRQLEAVNESEQPTRRDFEIGREGKAIWRKSRKQPVANRIKKHHDEWCEQEEGATKRYDRDGEIERAPHVSAPSHTRS